MTRAICPACRSAIPLDAALCGRCGLAVRPTCSNCGEVLASGDVACRRCRERIEAPPSEPVYAARVVAPPQTVTLVPRVAVQKPRVAEGKRSRSAVAVQLLVIAVVAGVVVAGGLLALELFAPRSEAPFDLVHRSYPALGFSLSRPNNWVESLHGATLVVSEPDGAARGIRVVAERKTLAAAHSAVSGEMRKPPGSRDPIALSDAMSVDGHAAFRYSFAEGGRFVEQWWIERPGGTFRVEFWAPQSAERDEGLFAGQIIATFTIG